MSGFQLVSPYTMQGSQPQAVQQLVEGCRTRKARQTLLGITGSGKTFVMAQVVQAIQRPTLVIAPNKILAAQLYQEFKSFFPHNAVEYFISYYDYYQPEAYVPRRDLYIEKDASINDELDRMRISATRSLFEREDVLVVASVSCIYGLGSPEAYRGMMIYLKLGEQLDRDELLARLVEIQFQRNDYDFHRGSFRVRGDVVEVFPAEAELAVRIEFFGNEIEALSRVDPVRGTKRELLSKVAIYPASHYVSPQENLPETVTLIDQELEGRLKELSHAGQLVEAQRLEQRTRFDMEMIQETGSCKGIENYSRIIARSAPGSPPPTLLDYFPADFMLFVDESHISIPQIGGMYRGDLSRKTTLVEHGFRLPSALDNRPLNFEEFLKRIDRCIFVSATPSDYELHSSGKDVAELLIRPTGLLDPKISVRPVNEQVDDLLNEIRQCVERKERVLVTTLTKRMAEDLSQYYAEIGVRVRYMHSEHDALERAEILRGLRLGEFDVLVGINLLREGLDLPEVALVAVLDADREGFLRSERSLLQICGRAARNLNGRVIFYADRETRSIRSVLEETKRRRALQKDYNKAHGIVPRQVQREVQEQLVAPKEAPVPIRILPEADLAVQIRSLEAEMLVAAKEQAYERAAELRDAAQVLKQRQLGLR